MNKLFAWGLADEDEAPPETRTFTDPRHPGEEFELCLIRPSLLEQAAISEVAEAYCLEYLGDDKHKGKAFLAPGGKRYRLNRAAIWEVSAVYCLQGGPAADRYLWTDLLGIYLKRGRLWRPASAWAGTLLEAEREALDRLGKPETEEPDEEESASAPPSCAPSPTPTSRTRTSVPAAITSSASSATASAV